MRDAMLASNLDRKNAVLRAIELPCHKASQQNKYRNLNGTIKIIWGHCALLQITPEMCVCSEESNNGQGRKCAWGMHVP